MGSRTGLIEGKVAMNGTKKMKIVVAATMMSLAALGLVAMWCVAPAIGGDELWAVKRQALWCCLGIAVAVLASRVTWQKWIRAAPWVAGVWLVLFVASAACPLENGWHRYLVVGPIKLDTWTLSWPVGGLALAWLRSVLPISNRMLFGALLGATLVCLTQSILTNANRVARVSAFVTGQELPREVVAEAAERNSEQEHLRTALSQSDWIGPTERAKALDVKYPHTSGLTSASAQRFGKIFPFGVLALFGLVAAGLVGIGRRMPDPTQRLFVLIYGMSLVGPAVMNVCECARLIPMFRFCIPLVSFGGAAFLSAGFGLGVMWAASRD